MGKIDRLIKIKLAQQAKGHKLELSVECPSDTALAKYASGGLDRAGRETIEKHTAECFLCLDKLVSSYEGTRLLKKNKLKEPPKHIGWKAKNIDRLSDELIKDISPKTQKSLAAQQAVIKWLPKNLKKNRWLIASITAFVLSFAFPPVFLQFLLAAGVLGGKWIFDSENARTLIMIYNAWKKGGEREVGEMLETLKDRIPNKR